MRWVTYNEETTNTTLCVEVGLSESSGERILLARAVVACRECVDRGRMPAIFMLDLGFAITHFGDFIILTDFELLCRQP